MKALNLHKALLDAPRRVVDGRNVHAGPVEALAVIFEEAENVRNVLRRAEDGELVLVDGVLREILWQARGQVLLSGG